MRRSPEAGRFPSALTLGLALAATFASATTSLAAEPKRAGKQPESFAMSREMPWTAAARTGQVLLKQGDFKRALEAYDAALRGSVEPALRRDRGVCHEMLGHPFPAMEDYRAYLTAQPDAADNEAIRDRLAKLERENGTAPKSEQDAAKKDEPILSVSMTAGRDGAVSANANATANPNANANDRRDFEQVRKDERLDEDATGAPLRRGKGFVIGPYAGLRYWGLSGLGWGEAYGAALRYSVSSVSSIAAELGYAKTHANDATAGGLASMLGYEARLKLNPRVDDAMILGAGLGYERLTSTMLIDPSWVLVGRLRVGYRHVFGPNVGLEAALDGGPAYFSYGVTQANGDTGKFTALVGLSLAIPLGF